MQDCSIELTIGRRYGLLGSNGSGKSNFLQCLAAREACPPPQPCLRLHPTDGALLVARIAPFQHALTLYT